MSKPIRRLTTSTNNAVNVEQKKVEQELREKVKTLELEVKMLKGKLDELRKAKNTMLIKKEKEFITTSLPQREPKPAAAETDDSLHEEMEQLKSELAKAKLKPTTTKPPVDNCGHEEIIEALQNRLSEVESMNTALAMGNEELREKLTESYEKISRKEAEHCDALEKVKVELQERWQEMYREWMRTTEHKIQELQAANDMMRETLERRRPH